MAIKTNVNETRALNNEAKNLYRELAQCGTDIDNALSSVVGNIVDSSAKSIYENLKSKNLTLCSNIVDELNSLSSFLEKQMEDYEMTEEVANGILKTAIDGVKEAESNYSSELSSVTYMM